jgi:hypothetical protein
MPDSNDTADQDKEPVTATVEFHSEGERDFAVQQILSSAEHIEQSLEVFDPAELDEHGRTEEDAIEILQSVANQIDSSD